MYKISKILLKYFTFGTNEEENRALEKWRTQSDQNEILFHKIGSKEFLEQAMDPGHKETLARDWVRIEKRTLRLERRRRFVPVSRWVAVFVLPVTAFLLYWSVDQSTGDLGKPDVVLSSQHLKAVIELAGGQRVVIRQDTVFKMNVEGTVMENSMDTVTFSFEAGQTVSSVRTHRIRVPEGGEYIARLEDGTVVHMDAASLLVVPQSFERGKREVELVGHAYFKVTKDSARPFVVKSGEMSVKVLGTEFDVNAYAGETGTTTLINGSVEIYTACSNYRLKPNQQAKVTGEGKIVVSNIDPYPFVAWKEERIVFRSASLESIMKVLERWYDVKAIFISNDLKMEKFTVDMEKYREIDRVLETIKQTGKVNFDIKGKQIFIRKVV